PLNAFGCVVPPRSERPVLAISYTSLKFPNRAPDGRVMVRVFLGGALRPELAELPDESLHEIVREQLRELLGYAGEPEMTRVVRWPSAMPQYHIGHVARLSRINGLLDEQPGLALAGNAYEGVGIPQCVRSGRQAAKRLVDASG
ncbi:MAG: protoporphyrinogen oxidase, partial [Planctomycetales bacterium]|nr:protoporphyrinogen oxidase [Planctomycetales bacterium]